MWLLMACTKWSVLAGYVGNARDPAAVPWDRKPLDNPADRTVPWRCSPSMGAETWARSPWPCFMNTGANKKGHFLATAETLISERDFEK